MDLRWDRNKAQQHQDENEAWETNSSDESSAEDYEGADMMMMQQPEVDIDDELTFEFPRDDLGFLLEGLNKWPWTVHLIQLTNCLISASKIASMGMEDRSSEFRRLQTLYREAIPSAFEKCLDDKAIWKWKDDVHNNIFEALCRLMDLVVAKLPLMQQEDASVMDDLLPLLRSLSLGFDKQSQFHLKHKENDRMSGPATELGSAASIKFARPLAGSPTSTKKGDTTCSNKSASSKDGEECDCSRCRPSNVYCCLSYLLNYFGHTSFGNGYHQLLRVLSTPQTLVPAVLEVVLLILSRSFEFLTNDVAELFAEPCNKVLKHITDKVEFDVDALSDKTKDGSFAALSSILKHLQVILARNSSVEQAHSVVSVVQRRLVERMLEFNSFNKQLSAVREINKLLENAGAIALRDNSIAVSTTISWLEKMDILRKVFRSHLHHKQYVDQVQKIMRFLLQEKKLSEEHLDAIWAATEKPDQFEAVISNLYDLIADLAQSFCPEQLDSLFGRFEQSQDQAAFDVGKLLTLLKKLARSDTKGIMASRLLELLWKMMLSDEALGEVLESGAFTEILAHYDSINCASKDLYMSRCLTNIKEGRHVIQSLRLLRDFIWLDHEKPFYQMRLQQLIKDHDLMNMVVSSLEKYMTRVRSCHAGTELDTQSLEALSSYYSHDDQVKERLSFLLIILQASSVNLSWDSAERLWTCMIDAPTCKADKESGFSWFCEALDKWTLFSLDAQINLLTKKLPALDPSSLSQAAWRCFLRLFLWVNQSNGKLKLTQLEEPVTHDLDLVGLPYLWSIALCSSQEPILDQSITFLREIYTSLSDALQEDLVGIRQRFLDKCIEVLVKALEVGGVKWSEGPECSSIPGCSMDEVVDEGPKKPGSKDLVTCNITENAGRCDSRSPSILTRFWSTQEAQQVEHCLKVLRTFIIRCEGRCPRAIFPHTAFFQGRPFLLGVSTVSKQSTRFDVPVHTNEYLSSLRAKVGKSLDHPASPSQVRLTYLNRELLQDSQVLWQCGLVGGQTVSASVMTIERASKASNEHHLPGVLLSKNPKFYNILFRLASAGNNNIREGANMLLALLPTHPAILANFQDLCNKDVEGGRSCLGTHFAAWFRLLYTLQVLDGLMIPTNRPIDSDTLKFRESFIRAGGIKHLLAVLQPEALPEGVDDQTRRGCYSSSVRLLKFLLSEKIASDHIGGPVSEAPDAAREDVSMDRKDVVSEEPAEASMQHRKSSVEQHGAQELSELADMASVVGALRRITWAAAMGRLSLIETSSSVATVLRRPSGKSAKKRAFPDDDETGLDPEDQYLCFEAMDFLVICLLRYKYLWRMFFTASDTESFIVALLLHSPDRGIRCRAALNLLKLCAIRHGHDRLAHRQVLAALLAAKMEASQHPKRCLHYWELLGHLFCTLEGAEEHEIAKQQLEDELQWLKSATTVVDDDDRLLEGHLHITRVLVEVLDVRSIGASRSQQGRGLVQLLIKHFLFPDATIILHEEDGRGNEARFRAFGMVPEEGGLLQAKCSTRGSREKAFQLLLCLATRCKESFEEIVDLIAKIHLSEQVTDWEHLPSYGRKALGGYVGLKNAGATCYMNSVFQQLFMQPEVRRSVLACTECDDVEKAGSVFFQLQAMFGALLGSSLDHYTPQGFWCAYRDYDGMPINLREHQDAFEFFNRLYDSIDATLKATHQETTLTRIFGGVFAQQVICRGCPHRSEREEPFAAISVDVKNKRDLAESLEAFVRGDLLEGDNAYYCDECGVKKDALKRVCVKSLPHTLVIHLKRFDFDYETMQRLKLKDRFEFPTHLDMKPFTVEGLALREAQGHAALSPRGGNQRGSKPDDVAGQLKPDAYYEYDLVGVVVHTGTAFAGHYYSYIKQRPGDHPLNCGHGQKGGWIAFDDKNVEPYDANDLEKDCFGGKYITDVYDNFSKTTTPQEYDTPNSAYMLFYEKSHSAPLSSYSPSRSTLSLSKGDVGCDEPMKEISLNACLPSLNIQMPASVHRSVWQENLRFIHENHLMDKDYFRFIYRLVEVNCELLEASCASRHHPKSAPVGSDQQHIGGVQSLCDPRDGQAGAQDAEANDFARIMTTLATEFLLKVYLRMHASLREDLLHWKTCMFKLFENSAAACRSFMGALVEHQNWVQEYLIWCPVEEVQQVSASMVAQALRCAVSFLQESVPRVDATDRLADTLCVNALVEILLSFLRDQTLPKYSCHQYFQVLLEYAKTGSAQRFHLLQKSALGLLVHTTIVFASKVNFQMAKLDFAVLHSLVSLLLRSCDISHLQNTTESDPERASSKKEDNVDSKRPGSSTRNPFQLPPPHFSLSKEAMDAILRQRVYISVVVQTCLEHEEAVKMLEFCCWNNEYFTTCLLQDLLESLHRTVSSDVKALLALMFRIVCIEDSLQKLRHKTVLLGLEGSRPGVMSLIVTRVMNVHKRYMLLKFVVKLVNGWADAKAHVQAKGADWKRVVDWLQDEMQPHMAAATGSNPMVSLPISNEDMSIPQLRRTSSAEWTLVNAQSLCGP